MMASNDNISSAGFSVEFVPWDSPGAEALKEIRYRVFVDEQKVPAELEIDEIDLNAVHVLARDRSGAPCGTGRMYPDPEDSSQVKIGRMAVICDFRGSGCGSAILLSLLDEARRQKYRTAVLSAQTHAVPFYRKFGFNAVGNIYDDAGIPHQFMQMELESFV